MGKGELERAERVERGKRDKKKEWRRKREIYRNGGRERGIYSLS